MNISPLPPLPPKQKSKPVPVPDTWRRELGSIALAALAGSLAGYVFDHAWLGLCLVLVLYLALYLRRLAKLQAWLYQPKQHDLPEPGGIWGEVFDRLLDVQRRNRRKKKRLSGMLAEFRASTEALPDGAVVLGERGEIMWFNLAAHTLLGLRVPQDVGLRIANLIRYPDFADYLAAGVYDGEVEAPSPLNRARTLSLRVIPYGNNQRLLIVRDVSELKRLETARRDFVSNASHELRTPLTVLRGYLDMLEPEAQGRGPLAEWRAPLMEMKNQAVRMESLVSDMLKLARLEADAQGQRVQDLLDVPRLLRRVLDEARSLSLGNHTFEARIQPDLCLLGGETEIMSIFGNLVSNAVRYTPPGGVIRVQWELDGADARFAVADTGIGIAAKDLPRLTERFYRADVGRSRASGGTGLGLSIVKHALELHDGTLQVESELGVGSTFICRFPALRVRITEPRSAQNATTKVSDSG
jgi:two-component system phosphate regulon sensor histidine kinase PhoR